MTPEEERRKRDEDNAGMPAITSSGHIGIGLGGGLGIDLQDGSLTVQVSPGFSIDLGGNQ